MSAPNSPAMTDMEPTPEFYARCLDIIERWEAGHLPFLDAMQMMLQLSQEATASGHLANQGRAEHSMGYMQHYRGNLNTSIMHYERARKFYERVGNHHRIAIMDMNQGENYRNKGEFTRARRLYRACYEKARELGDVALQSMAMTNEGLVLVTVGDYRNALIALNEAYALSGQFAEARPHELEGLRCEIHHGLATIYLAAGDFMAAWEQAHLALENAAITDQPLQVGYANRIVGEVLAALGQSPDPTLPSNPDEYFRSAIRAFEEINADGEIARTMFAQAKSLANRGKQRAAAKTLQQVMIIFTNLGMTDDAAKAAAVQRAVIS